MAYEAIAQREELRYYESEKENGSSTQCLNMWYL